MMALIFKQQFYIAKVCIVRGHTRKNGATAVHPNYRYLQDAIAELTMESGVEVRPYTINEETLMRKYFDMNISAIITDYPETARTSKK